MSGVANGWVHRPGATRGLLRGRVVAIPKTLRFRNTLAPNRSPSSPLHTPEILCFLAGRVPPVLHGCRFRNPHPCVGCRCDPRHRGKRTAVTQALRVMGLADRPELWPLPCKCSIEATVGCTATSSLAGFCVICSPCFGLMVDTVVIAIDDTIERRWGAKIKARGIYPRPRAPRRMATSSKPVVCAGYLWRWCCRFLSRNERCGLAIPDRAGAVGIDGAETQEQAAQNPDRLGPVRPYYKANDGWPIRQCGGRRRQQLSVRAGVDRRRASSCLPDRRGYCLDASLFEPAPERRPNQNGQAQTERQSAGQTQCHTGRSENRLDQDHDDRMVQPGPRARGSLRRGYAASVW